MIDCQSELSRQRLGALYVSDRRGRMVSVNEWNRPAVPRFHLMRTTKAAFSRFRADVTDEVVAKLEALGDQEPLGREQSQSPAQEAKFLELLGHDASASRVWSGPVFIFPDELPKSESAVSIDQSNSHLLVAEFDDWLPDVVHRQPFKAVVVNDRAASICASVRISDAVHCAGVETQAKCRGKGLAARAVANWALAVRELGATPFYSTSWTNEASRRVAARLNLVFVGIDFHVT